MPTADERVLRTAGVEKRTYAMLVAFDGGPYKGWQPHPALATAGGLLASALHRAGVRANPFGASRTDAGVHARAQVASFTTKAGLDPQRTWTLLNQELPNTIHAVALRRAARSFHAHWSSCGKVYRYRISFRPERAAWCLPPSPLRPTPLDPIRLEQALGMIEAAPDVSALSESHDDKARKVRAARLLRFDDTGALLELEAAGFGKYLVRNLVAASVALATGAITTDGLGDILGGRAKKPRRAPPDGLCLHRVLYPPQLDPFDDADALASRAEAALPILSAFRSTGPRI
ncbi:MAG: hypothetical protein ACOX6T_11415 [Myxococcales bacterium]|jgi:tRNA pseudouridine38-40 synthase